MARLSRRTAHVRDALEDGRRVRAHTRAITSTSWPALPTALTSSTPDGSHHSEAGRVDPERRFFDVLVEDDRSLAGAA